MFILFGTWPLRLKMGHDVQTMTQCPNCYQISYWNIIRVFKFFTLFFIPLIPFWMQYYMTCPHCDAAVKIKGSEAKEKVSGSGAEEVMDANTTVADDATFRTVEAETDVEAETQQTYDGAAWGTHATDDQPDADSFSNEQQTSYEFHAGYAPFILPTEHIIQHETKGMQKYGLIIAGLAGVTIILWVTGALQNMMESAFLVLCVLALVIMTPIPFINIHRRKNMIPSRLLIQSGYLWIDNESISIHNIKTATITSLLAKSDSFLPKQRFLTIKTDTEKKRYWLGSSNSFHDSDYAALKNMLQYGLSEHGVMLKELKK